MNLIDRAMAQVNQGISVAGNGIESSTSGIGDFINKVVQGLSIIAGGVAIIYLIYSGILYLTAAGNPDAAKKGQQGVVNAIIGIIIIVLAYTIINLAIGAGNQLQSGS